MNEPRKMPKNDDAGRHMLFSDYLAEKGPAFLEHAESKEFIAKVGEKFEDTWKMLSQSAEQGIVPKDALKSSLDEADSYIDNYFSKEESQRLSKMPEQTQKTMLMDIFKNGGTSSADEAILLKYHLQVAAKRYVQSELNCVRAKSLEAIKNDAVKKGPATKNELQCDPADDGDYLYTDNDGKVMYVKNISDWSYDSSNGKRYRSRDFKQFVDAEKSKEERAELHRGLSVTEFRSEDKLHPCEDSLIGQEQLSVDDSHTSKWMGAYGGKIVPVAVTLSWKDKQHKKLRQQVEQAWYKESSKARDFPAKVRAPSCLFTRLGAKSDSILVMPLDADGKAFGESMSIKQEMISEAVKHLPKEFERLLADWPKHQTYLVSLNHPDTDVPQYVCLGKGKMAKMNTQFDFDKHGLPFRQSLQPCNVTSVKFRGELQDGTPIAVLAFRKGDGLRGQARWNYGYSPETITERFRGGMAYVPELDGVWRAPQRDPRQSGSHQGQSSELAVRSGASAQSEDAIARKASPVER